MKQSSNWSEYWANEGSSGEVFVDKKGQKHPVLRQFWKQCFDQVAPDARVIDLACGGGSIFADNIESCHQYDLYAVDISDQALVQLKKRVPNATTIESSVDHIPLEKETFDLVVSQFGIEYVGETAFVEAARLMADNAQLVVLCHIKNGFIDAKNQSELAGVKLLESTNFIEKSMAVTRASYQSEEINLQQAFDAFTKIEPKIAEMANNNSSNLLSHCYFGFRKMFERKNAYYLSDIVDWLKAMKLEQQKSLERLKSMRRAALSEPQVKSICNTLKQKGLTEIQFKPFTLPDKALPVAWCITGRKK